MSPFGAGDPRDTPVLHVCCRGRGRRGSLQRRRPLRSATAARGTPEGRHEGPAHGKPPPRNERHDLARKKKEILDQRAVERTLNRMAEEITELNGGTDNLILVGIQRRGVQLATRLATIIEQREKATVRRGSLDITLYRDDLQTVGPRPVVGPTDLPWNLDSQNVVIVDDVLYTGRTIRAALDELTDFGRAARIALAVLVDRGGRELPIHADIVGKKIDVGEDERIDVLVEELDGKDSVVVVPREGAE